MKQICIFGQSHANTGKYRRFEPSTTQRMFSEQWESIWQFVCDFGIPDAPCLGKASHTNSNYEKNNSNRWGLLGLLVNQVLNHPQHGHFYGSDSSRSQLAKCVDISEFPQMGTPIAGWLIRENPIKMDDLGVPPFYGPPHILFDNLDEPATRRNSDRPSSKGSLWPRGFEGWVRGQSWNANLAGLPVRVPHWKNLKTVSKPRTLNHPNHPKLVIPVYIQGTTYSARYPKHSHFSEFLPKAATLGRCLFQCTGDHSFYNPNRDVLFVSSHSPTKKSISVSHLSELNKQYSDHHSVALLIM